MYHATCHNLSVVNDKLTRAQGTVEVRGREGKGRGGREEREKKGGKVGRLYRERG